MATTKIRGQLVDLNEATSESGLKIPTGTVTNRPATNVTGMVRNSTYESSQGSASSIEYYNGAEWIAINNTAVPPVQVDFLVVAGGGGGGTSLGDGAGGIGGKGGVFGFKNPIFNSYIIW